ncbi:hypothetical protein SEUBUCD646_0C00740 [Saccharomyces eubayanus]|uniref:Flavodoxin-like fold protein n=2 Tax=Saccharomyces TaxID=4930 RepID=A0A6C1E435_SACPS|nr:YCP4-like protein [Saccharomyces eubayanus]KOH00665.1 YCP4-like protein [Saccharomyces eubayanus]QID83895.1 flavodoxin-like fold protein [Saccharomyces pastorianus]CAI1873996.1 hypothetical protein SEUBUCD650_0C00700 [Saccharomyces eubayanus]CAI1907504.1 hypothetical protein SEUBUCD646_0C00740 [Saccharomyces eubayanus]
MVKIAIITYSTYGHIDVLAQAVKKGVEAAGGKADIYRVEETLPDEVLTQMNAPEKPDDIPVATEETLIEYDAFLFGVPTRFGNLPAQWSAFWDKTGGLWAKGSLSGKAAGVFVSTSTYGGGQESTVKACLSYLAHHGIIFLPLGYKNSFAELASIEEVHGGSPWGAGTLAGPDGSRTASPLELRIAEIQGKTFYETTRKLFPVKEAKPSTEKKATASDAAKRQTKPAAAATAEKKEDKGLLSCCTIM